MSVQSFSRKNLEISGPHRESMSQRGKTGSKTGRIGRSALRYHYSCQGLREEYRANLSTLPREKTGHFREQGKNSWHLRSIIQTQIGKKNFFWSEKLRTLFRDHQTKSPFHWSNLPTQVISFPDLFKLTCSKFGIWRGFRKCLGTSVTERRCWLLIRRENLNRSMVRWVIFAE